MGGDIPMPTETLNATTENVVNTIPAASTMSNKGERLTSTAIINNGINPSSTLMENNQDNSLVTTSITTICDNENTNGLKS